MGKDTFDGRQAQKGRLLKGAAILGLATVISKLLGTLQKIPLQNIAGDEVFGIYNAVYPLYIFILTLATAGFPIAVSRFVADYAVRGSMAEARRVFRIAVWLLAGTGLAGFAVLYTAADPIAAAIGMSSAAAGIRSVSFALLAAPVMAAIRGYFQGLQNMVPTAVTQVIEQFIRVSVMLGLLFWLMHRHAAPEVIAAGATFGSTAGAAGGLLAALWFWRRSLRPVKRHAQELSGGSQEGGAGQASAKRDGEGAGREEGGVSWSLAPSGGFPKESTLRFIRRFAGFAIPVCLGTVALPVLTLVDAFTVPRMLKSGGMTESAAAHLFGLYNHGLPLVQLVAMIATSMSAALVPSVAEAAAIRDGRLLQARTEPVLRFTWLAGLAAAFGLAATSLPVNVMLFASPQGWPAMAIVAFTALFATLHVVTGSMLQGLGAVMVPARSLFAAAAVKTAGNLLLVPALGIEGAAIAAVLAYTCAFALNLRTLKALAPQAVAPWRTLLRPLGAALAMVLAVLAVEWSILHLPGGTAAGHGAGRLRHTAAALAAIAAGAAVYAAALFRTGAVRPAELALLPGFDTRWKPLLHKLRLLPEAPPQDRTTNPS